VKDGQVRFITVRWTLGSLGFFTILVVEAVSYLVGMQVAHDS